MSPLVIPQWGLWMMMIVSAAGTIMLFLQLKETGFRL